MMMSDVGNKPHSDILRAIRVVHDQDCLAKGSEKELGVAADVLRDVGADITLEAVVFLEENDSILFHPEDDFADERKRVIMRIGKTKSPTIKFGSGQASFYPVAASCHFKNLLDAAVIIDGVASQGEVVPRVHSVENGMNLPTKEEDMILSELLYLLGIKPFRTLQHLKLLCHDCVSFRNCDVVKSLLLF